MDFTAWKCSLSEEDCFQNLVGHFHLHLIGEKSFVLFSLLTSFTTLLIFSPGDLVFLYQCVVLSSKNTPK